MTKVVACIICRTVSKRLPLKVLRSIGGEYTMLDFMIKRLMTVGSIDDIFICTSDEAVDDIMEDISTRNNIGIYRGSPDNVIDRMLAVGELTDADMLLRITGDNPLTSYEYIDHQVKMLVESNLDYIRLIDVPVGATAEVMTRKALIKCYEKMDPSVSEYLMLFMFEPQNFKCGVIKPFLHNFGSMTITVDTPEDLVRTHTILSYFKKSIDIKLSDIIEVIQHNNVPNAVIEGKGSIKLPYGKSIEFNDFIEDMNRRIKQSKIIELYA